LGVPYHEVVIAFYVIFLLLRYPVCIINFFLNSLVVIIRKDQCPLFKTFYNCK
jgi:hypothetical protein